MQALEIDHRQPTVPMEADGHVRVADRIHGRGQERDLESVVPDVDGGLDLGRVDGHRAGDEGDLLEAIRPPEAAADVDRRIEERS